MCGNAHKGGGGGGRGMSTRLHKVSHHIWWVQVRLLSIRFSVLAYLKLFFSPSFDILACLV